MLTLTLQQAGSEAINKNKITLEIRSKNVLLKFKQTKPIDNQNELTQIRNKRFV